MAAAVRGHACGSSPNLKRTHTRVEFQLNGAHASIELIGRLQGRKETQARAAWHQGSTAVGLRLPCISWLAEWQMYDVGPDQHPPHRCVRTALDRSHCVPCQMTRNAHARGNGRSSAHDVCAAFWVRCVYQQVGELPVDALTK